MGSMSAAAFYQSFVKQLNFKIMATVILKERYKCFDDCRQEGCPEHEATLQFQTVSNAYIFENGKGKKYYFEQGEIETLVSLLKQLSERRCDSVRF